MQSAASLDSLQRFNTLSESNRGLGLTPEFLETVELATPVLIEAYTRFSAWLQQQRPSSQSVVSTLVERKSNKVGSETRFSADSIAEQLKISDPWVDAKWIMQKYLISYRSARRWILKLHGDDAAMLDKRRRQGKRPYRMRRIPLSVLEEHIDELLNH